MSSTQFKKKKYVSPIRPEDRHKLIPTDLVENLAFRRDLLKKCLQDREYQLCTIEACKHDPLFFLNAFCWVYEPRPRFSALGRRIPNERPFIAWPHQIPVIKEIHKNLGVRDCALEKSRGEGASWMVVLLAMHAWTFQQMASIGLVSKDEVSADDPKNPDSLMWKCDFTVKQLPSWMVGSKNKGWKRDVSKHVLLNEKTGSTITGFSATGNVASGGRKSWFLMDELAKFPRPDDEAAMASTQHVTECRVVVSTPLGSSGAYYDLMHEPSNMTKMVLDWKDNETRNQGLYKLVKGKPVAIDPQNNPMTPEYEHCDNTVLELFARLRRKGYKLEDTVRSPWFDRECDRMGATPTNIAQELERDYGGSMYRYFGSGFIDKVEATVRRPAHVGEFTYDHTKLESSGRFDEVQGGPLKIWGPLDSRGFLPFGRYALGCDVCAGSGGAYSSNSTIVACDVDKKEQVAEYALNTIQPSEFADLAVAFAYWLHGAQLGWEHNGPGTLFTKRILETGYEKIYFRQSHSRRGIKRTKEAGWWTDERSKEVMFGQFRTAVIMGEFFVRSKELLAEAKRYIRRDGKIMTELLTNKNMAEDAKGASHGDRVVGACVMIQTREDTAPLDERSEESYENAPPNSPAGRLKEYEDEQREREADGWEDGVFAGSSWMG